MLQVIFLTTGLPRVESTLYIDGYSGLVALLIALDAAANIKSYRVTHDGRQVHRETPLLGHGLTCFTKLEYADTPESTPVVLESNHSNYDDYTSTAKTLEHVRTVPIPEGQKFPTDARVRIADDLGCLMSHFTKGIEANIAYSYHHAYGQGAVDEYCLRFDDNHFECWYSESQLTLVEGA
jgi:hypothetical protein